MQEIPKRDTPKRNIYTEGAELLPAPVIVNIFKRFTGHGDTITVKGLCATKQIRTKDSIMDTDKLVLNYGAGKYCDIKFKHRYGRWLPKGWRLNRYSFSIDINSTLDLDIQNKLILVYNDENEGRIVYTARDYVTGRNRNSTVFHKGNAAIYFRQTVRNTMYLTVRDANIYDHREGRLRILKAYILSKLYRRKMILMYEKDCSRYEESASVLFEKLIDKGYRNIYYVLNSDNPALKTLDERYKKNILYKDSFKHALCFFRSKTFISTETIDHSMQLRAANRLIQSKYRSRDLKYVFLQHGVMYMVSMDSDLRSGFKQKDIALYRVVVSSEEEANHFVSLGGFDRSDLYVTGLAKFDKSYLNKDADKITIMPTWRRWEANIAKNNIADTGYYKMIKNIIAEIPSEYKDKVVVLPHPLMLNAIKNSDNEINKYILESKTHDEILRETRLLITDYSSIAYDAFYRGSNIVFYWGEKEECMEHYGAHLMLNESNVFGDICYDFAEISKAVSDNYNSQQKELHIDRYRDIVSFFDNKNTERIISKLIEDSVI